MSEEYRKLCAMFSYLIKTKNYFKMNELKNIFKMNELKIIFKIELERHILKINIFKKNCASTCHQGDL